MKEYNPTVSKPEPVTRYLARRFGGKWKYRIHEGWECDDGNRYVLRVATGRDMEGEYDGTSAMCMYYRDNSKYPEWV